jgi:excisionase family DNA binding protein
MGITITLRIGDQQLLAEIDEQAVAAIASAAANRASNPSDTYLTVPEAAVLLRCKRQRIDDLLSQGRLQRVKEGGRTLVRRDDVAKHLERSR